MEDEDDPPELEDEPPELDDDDDELEDIGTQVRTGSHPNPGGGFSQPTPLHSSLALQQFCPQGFKQPLLELDELEDEDDPPELDELDELEDEEDELEEVVQ